jgi:predicted dehydrogenase
MRGVWQKDARNRDPGCRNSGEPVVGEHVKSMSMPELHIGVVGAGEFAKFAATAFLRVPGVKVVAITDINPDAARSMGAAFNGVVHEDFEDLLKNTSVQLIYIATPPYLHYDQSRLALLAGKHVICEKPAALKTSEAEALVKLAKANHLLYVVNLMQRYNPLFGIVKAIVDERLLGDFRHGFFENYASDEFLGPQHWFWDPAKSGGIFIEHGVHFFDLFSGWLGEGKLLAALQLRRPAVKSPTPAAPSPTATQPIPATPIVDRVQATVLYKTGPVNFYHGFDQPKILDRQEMRLLFESGDITLYEWVPVKMRLHGLLGPDASPITLEYKNPAGKQELYQQMLTAMLSDQWTWIKDRTHIRVIDDDNAVQSLRIAEEATASSKICQQQQ